MSDLAPPKHIAIIMDGNGRWAKAKKQRRTQGHVAGAKAVRATIENCARRGVQYLTLYAFSSENWSRSDGEINTLMQLFMRAIASEMPDLIAANIRVRFIGQRDKFSSSMQQAMAKAEADSAAGTAMTVNVALNYGGRDELVYATRALAAKVAAGQLNPDGIAEADIGAKLYTAGQPDPDLLIRTSGEHRISNFLLWQLAYSELYFTDVYWPDFDAQELDKAIASYHNRDRRFGKEEAE
ncbi:MAG: isoprenyl transferase [Gammaproteobacteria bacterium]|nr:isoprenyl transferase [Gammaproteobacteria bacterium]